MSESADAMDAIGTSRRPLPSAVASVSISNQSILYSVMSVWISHTPQHLSYLSAAAITVPAEMEKLRVVRWVASSVLAGSWMRCSRGSEVAQPNTT